MLTAKPTANVLVSSNLRGGDIDLTVADTDPDTDGIQNYLTFTGDNWNTAQTLTVNAAEDDDTADGTATFSHVAGSGDSRYANIRIASLTAIEDDNDTAGVEVTGSPLNVNEGSTNTYTLVLTAKPNQDAAITITKKSGGDGDLNPTDSTPLTFTSANWDTAQTVTVSAAEDNADSATGSATFEHSASSVDSRYNLSAVTISDLVAKEVDNDTPGVTVTGSPLNVNEGSTATYTVVLDAQPSSEVTITVTKKSGGDADLTLSGSSALTFTGTTWDTAQTVTVSAAEDNGDLANGSATFQHGAGSGDTRYHGKAIDNLVANEVENDTPGVTVTDSPLNVNEGSTATYTLVLEAQPNSNVTITITKASGGDSDLTLSGSSALTFTGTTWDTAQTVTVSAVEDDADSAAGSATFQHGASSGDTRYHGKTIDNLVANEVDNDTLGAPANLRAAPGDRQVRLSWDAVTGATEYEYQQTSSGSFGTTWSSTGSTETSTTVTGLNNGTQYSFRVRAVKVSSPRIAGPPSNPVEAMPLAAPLNLVAIPGDKYITLSWNQVAGVNEHNWLYYFGRGLSHGLWLSSTHDPVLGGGRQMDDSPVGMEHRSWGSSAPQLDQWADLYRPGDPLPGRVSRSQREECNCLRHSVQHGEGDTHGDAAHDHGPDGHGGQRAGDAPVGRHGRRHGLVSPTAERGRPVRSGGEEYQPFGDLRIGLQSFHRDWLSLHDYGSGEQHPVCLPCGDDERQLPGCAVQRTALRGDMGHTSGLSTGSHQSAGDAGRHTGNAGLGRSCRCLGLSVEGLRHVHPLARRAGAGRRPHPHQGDDAVDHEPHRPLLSGAHGADHPGGGVRT